MNDHWKIEHAYMILIMCDNTFRLPGYWRVIKCKGTRRLCIFVYIPTFLQIRSTCAFGVTVFVHLSVTAIVTLPRLSGTGRLYPNCDAHRAGTALGGTEGRFNQAILISHKLFQTWV